MVRARSEAHAARNELIRTTFSSLELSTALPPTASTVSDSAKAANVAHSVEDIPGSEGANIHWLGDKSASNVLLYFHGGGFALPPTDGHLKFLFEAVRSYEKSTGQKLLVGFLEYTLSGVERFPRQYTQASAALRHIISQGYKPSNIVVGGDSAGGNMALGVISQSLHPMEGVLPVQLAEPLAGVLLISPWISFDETTKSFKECQDTDICGVTLLSDMFNSYIAPRQRNNWSEPLLAESSWWRGFPAKSVLNIWGEVEMLRDAICKLGTNLASAGVNVQNVECPLHVHVDCVLDAQSGMGWGEMSKDIWTWLSTTL